MRDVRLDEVLAQLPRGLPVPVACWLMGRVAHAMAARPRLLCVDEIGVREDGGVRVHPAKGPVPFAGRAPEVIKGGSVDARAAVFGLGTVLVEALTGRSPFARGSDMETRIAVTEETVPALVGRVAQASSALDEIVRRALAKAPEDRFGSTVELGEALDGFLERELYEVGPADMVAAVRMAAGGDPDPPSSPPPALRAQALPPARPAAGAPKGVSPEGILVPRAARAAPAAEPEGLSAPRPLSPHRTPAEPAPPRSAPPRSAPQPSEPAGLPAPRSFGPAPDDAPALPPLEPSLAAAASSELELDLAPLPRPRRSEPAPRSARLEIDREALEATRAASVRPAELPALEDGGGSDDVGTAWIKPVGLGLLILLGLAIVYQFVVRPLLH